MSVLVCGDRYWNKPGPIQAWLTGLWAMADDEPEFVVIEGGCKRKLDDGSIVGADYLASVWAKANKSEGVTHEPHPAEWALYGDAAGPLRNTEMLKAGKPDLVLAFHDNIEDSKGTKDMVTKAKAAGVPVYLVSRP